MVQGGQITVHDGLRDPAADMCRHLIATVGIPLCRQRALCRVSGVDIAGTTGCKDGHSARKSRLKLFSYEMNIVTSQQQIVRRQNHWMAGI